MIDPNEAPAGFIAVTYTSCRECALYRLTLCSSSTCEKSFRSDKEIVMFAHALAAIGHPQPSTSPTVTATKQTPPTSTKHIPSAGMCAECSKHIPDKCSQLPFSKMEVIRTLPAHKLVVVRCTNFDR